MQARPATEADIEAAAALQSDAFGGDPAAWIQRYREGTRFTWRDGWVVEADDGTIGAAALALPLTWHYNGATYPISGIAAVAVHPLYRRRGYASAMLRALVAADFVQNRACSLLSPFQSGFYRRLGYAPVGLTHFYRIPLAQLPDRRALRLNVRMLRESDHEAVYDLHRQSLLHGAGGLERHARQWIERWTRDNERWVVYDDGNVTGYLAYQRIEHELSIRELIAATAEAERGLWSFVAAQAEQAVAVTYHAPINKPLWAMLREPAMFNGADRGNDQRDAAALTAGLMGRITNLPLAFEQRRFDPRLSGSVTLTLHDPCLDMQNGTWIITFAAGRASVARNDGPGTATCDIVTLTQLFCGVLRAGDARWYGLLNADDATTALLDQAFGGPTPFIHPADAF